MDANRKTQNTIEYLFLAIVWISCFACLVRTDFNFPFAFLSYYLFVSKNDKTITLVLIVINAVILAIDLIFMLSIGGIWTATVENNNNWNSRHSLHVFAIICSVVNMILKIVLLYLLTQYRKKQSTEDTMPLANEKNRAYDMDNINKQHI